MDLSQQIPIEGLQEEDDIPLMVFEVALHMIKGGHLVTRKGWNGKGQYVALTSVYLHPHGPRRTCSLDRKSRRSVG